MNRSSRKGGRTGIPTTQEQGRDDGPIHFGTVHAINPATHAAHGGENGEGYVDLEPPIMIRNLTTGRAGGNTLPPPHVGSGVFGADDGLSTTQANC